MQASKLAVESRVPDFSATTFDGRPVAMKDYQGKRNLVMVFLRGFA